MRLQSVLYRPTRLQTVIVSRLIRVSVKRERHYRVLVTLLSQRAGNGSRPWRICCELLSIAIYRHGIESNWKRGSFDFPGSFRGKSEERDHGNKRLLSTSISDSQACFEALFRRTQRCGRARSVFCNVRNPSDFLWTALLCVSADCFVDNNERKFLQCRHNFGTGIYYYWCIWVHGGIFHVWLLCNDLLRPKYRLCLCSGFRHWSILMGSQ